MDHDNDRPARDTEASLALNIMEGSANAAEQDHYAQRLITVGERLQRRASSSPRLVIEGEVVADRSIALPAYTVEPD